jgi:signal peptidase
MGMVTKVLKKIGSVFISLIFLCLLVFGLSLIAIRLSGGRVFVIETASMQNVCPVGSIVIVDNSSPEQLKAGDIISFVADEKLTVVTHRITQNDTENEKIYTKGDMNNTPDSNPVDYKNVIGKVRFTVPKLGYVLLGVKNKTAKIIIAAAAVLAVAYCLWQIIRRLYRMQKRRKITKARARINGKSSENLQK